jgi:hypothetical protein
VDVSLKRTEKIINLILPRRMSVSLKVIAPSVELQFMKMKPILSHHPSEQGHPMFSTGEAHPNQVAWKADDSARKKQIIF